MYKSASSSPVSLQGVTELGLGIPPTLPCQAISPAVPSPLSSAATSPKHVYFSHESAKASERIVGASGLAVVVGLVHWNLPGHLLGTGTLTGRGTALGWRLSSSSPWFGLLTCRGGARLHLIDNSNRAKGAHACNPSTCLLLFFNFSKFYLPFSS